MLLYGEKQCPVCSKGKTCHTYFVTLNSRFINNLNNYNINRETELQHTLSFFYKKKEYYFFPPYFTENGEDVLTSKKSYGQSFFNDSLRVDSIVFPKNAPFYIKNDVDDELYQFFYIEGEAIRVMEKYDYLRDLSSHTLFEKWNLGSVNCYFSFDKSIPYFYIYLFYKVNKIDVNRPPTGFYLWQQEGNVGNVFD